MRKQQIDTYDYFVIGAGSGGVRSARIAASHGAKVAVAEKQALGGTCVNIGCVPKKLFAYGSDFSMEFEDAVAYGWSVSKTSFNWNTLRDNKTKEIKRLNGIYENLLKKNNVDLFKGEATFIDKNTIEVDGKQIKADKILIATGGTPRRPEISGSEHIAVSDDMFYLKTFPKKVTIIGGGYIAVEFAHILHGLGAEVDLIQRSDQLLNGFDSDIRKTLAEEMQKQGINIHFNTKPIKVEKSKDAYILHTDKGQQIKTDLVMAAIGRDPLIDNLKIDKAGVTKTQSGKIAVDQEFKTNIDNIYAVGDVSSAKELTPMAIAEGHALADRLFNKQNRTLSYENIPTAVFSQPQVGTVGLSEEEAIDKGFKTKVFITKFTPLKHTLSGRDEKTMMKLVVDEKSDKVLGVHMVGADAAEIIQGFAVALNAGATKAVFDKTIGIHPTSAEEFVTMRTPRAP
jgi:glutathione reductase (NADPH)